MAEDVRAMMREHRKFTCVDNGTDLTDVQLGASDARQFHLLWGDVVLANHGRHLYSTADVAREYDGWPGFPPNPSICLLV